MPVKLPDDGQSLLLVGKNGSGKTRAAVWHVAQTNVGRHADARSWIVINHKREKMINSIPGAQFVAMDERPVLIPKMVDGERKLAIKEPGIYIYQPRPEIDDDAVTDLLWWVYETEGIGVYIDEGYMISPRDPALNSLYTQGRSKEIPIITLSQRPSGISRRAVSEATFVQVFRLTDKRDWKTMQEVVPVKLDPYMRPMNGQQRLMPDYHSLYYDTREDDPVIARPVPGDEEIFEQLRVKLIPIEAEKPIDRFNKL